MRFVGVDVNDSRAAARGFLERYHISYPSLSDPDARLIVSFRGVIPVSAVPSTVVVDQQGRVAARTVGPTAYLALRGLVRDVARTGRTGGPPSNT